MVRALEVLEDSHSRAGIVSVSKGWSLRLRALLYARKHGIDNLPDVGNAEGEIDHGGGVLERFFVCANRDDSIVGADLEALSSKLRLVRNF
jgi:hypothetical protein